jgi:hypothetical protein
MASEDSLQIRMNKRLIRTAEAGGVFVTGRFVIELDGFQRRTPQQDSHDYQ